jgi:hypothetical protein
MPEILLAVFTVALALVLIFSQTAKGDNFIIVALCGLVVVGFFCIFKACFV